MAISIPCAAHSLNLVGVCAVESCAEAISFFGIVQQIFPFFSASTHRWSILLKSLGSQLVVKRVSDTRWSARADATKALAKGYTSIQEALKCIMEDENQKAEARSDAKNLLKRLSSLETAFMAIFWYKILDRFNKVSEHLHKEDMELGTAVQLLASLEEYVILQHNDFDKDEEDAKEKPTTAEYKDYGRRPRQRKKQVNDGK